MATDLITYSVPYTGQFAGSATAVQLPTGLQRVCKRVTIMGHPNNSGILWVSAQSDLTIGDATTDDPGAGVPLIASQAITIYMPTTALIYQMGSTNALVASATQAGIIVIET